MRLQPPINQKEFTGKKATKKIIISYIGSHRLFSNEGVITLDNYFKSIDGFDENFKNMFLTLFPLEIQDFAKLYLDEIQNEKEIIPPNQS